MIVFWILSDHHQRPSGHACDTILASPFRIKVQSLEKAQNLLSIITRFLHECFEGKWVPGGSGYSMHVKSGKRDWASKLAWSRLCMS